MKETGTCGLKATIASTLEWGLSLEARGLHARSPMACGAALPVARVLISGPKPPYFIPAIHILVSKMVFQVILVPSGIF